MKFGQFSNNILGILLLNLSNNINKLRKFLRFNLSSLLDKVSLSPSRLRLYRCSSSYFLKNPSPYLYHNFCQFTSRYHFFLGLSQYSCLFVISSSILCMCMFFSPLSCPSCMQFYTICSCFYLIFS